MPSWYVHKLIDKLVLGKEHEDVHRFLDEIGVILNKGRPKGHRKVWGHDPKHIFLLYLITKDLDKAISGWLHILADNSIPYKESKKIEAILKLLDIK